MKLNLFRKQSKKIGLEPGAPIFVGEKKTHELKISLIDYDKEKIIIEDVKNVDDLFQLKDTPSVSWINIDGVHDTEIIKKICNGFDIHSLVSEDILNTGQRPKFEEYDNYVYIVLKMINYDENNHLNPEQMSIILGKNFVITFQEQPRNIFDSLLKRIKSGNIRSRRNTCDYLAYAIMDIVIDYYFIVLENINNRLDVLDESISDHPSDNLVAEIRIIKRELLLLRKLIWPVRELVDKALSEGQDHFIESTQPFLRDIRDHILQIIETLELFRDVSNNLLIYYETVLSVKMNSVMKTLTLIAAIFIPLTFIAGIYGMNFHYMPELQWKWGYFSVLILFAAISVSLIILFKHKKWF